MHYLFIYSNKKLYIKHYIPTRLFQKKKINKKVLTKVFEIY